MRTRAARITATSCVSSWSERAKASLVGCSTMTVQLRRGPRLRRHLERNDVDPILQIVSKVPGLDRSVEVDVGRHNQSEFGLDRLGAANPLDFPFLNGAQ